MTPGLKPFTVFIHLFLGCIQWMPNITLFTQGPSRVCHCYDPKWHVSNNIYWDSIVLSAQREKQELFFSHFDVFSHRQLTWSIAVRSLFLSFVFVVILKPFFGGICGWTSSSFHIHCSAMRVWLLYWFEFIPFSSCGLVFVFMILVQIFYQCKSCWYKFTQ